MYSKEKNPNERSHLELTHEAMQVGPMNRYESDCCYWVAAWQSQFQLLQQVEALEVL